MCQSKSIIFDESMLGTNEVTELTLGCSVGADDCEGACDMVGLEVEV